MEDKTEAIEQILGIARRHGLTPAEIESAFKQSESEVVEPSTSLLGRILG